MPRHRTLARWRVLLVLAFALLLPIAQQVAQVCCLPCVIEDASEAHAPGEHREHAGLKSTCETCAACASLLAAVPPSLPHVRGLSAGVVVAVAALAFRDVVTTVPFASRAPPPASA